jgi:hypothetical protein
VPPALKEWRAARRKVAHNLILRTLVPFLSDLEMADASKRVEILGDILDLWDDGIKPILTKIIQEALGVLSPRLFLEAFIKDEEALSSLEQQAFQRHIAGRESLRYLVSDIQAAFETADRAIRRLEESPVPGATEAQRVISKLHEILQVLPTSPVMP